MTLRRTRIHPLSFALAALPLVAGCDDAPVDAPDAPAVLDASLDASLDAPVDVAPDLASDAPTDVPRDATPDVAPDVTRDAAIDARADVAPDVLRCDAPLTACAGSCVNVSTALAHCGRCEHSCAAPLHGVAVCASGACAFTCEDTYAPVGAACVRVDPPRLIAPLSTARVTSRRPRLRWSLAAGSDGAAVDLCADRACATVLSTLTATGAEATPASDLAPGRVFWRARGRAGATTGTANSPVWQFVVGARSATVNTSWGEALDANGDGRTDLAVGAPNRMMSTGRVLFYAAGAGNFASPPTATFDGTTGVNAVFGGAIACAGDVNGDGFVDLAVGAYRAATGAGRVYVYAGGATGLGAAAATTLNGRDGADGDFGFALAGAGDVNGDGFSDLVVGAPVVSRFTGRAYVFHGGATGLGSTPATSLTGPDGPDGNFGLSVASAGDVNGDGYSDVLVSAPFWMTATGRVYLYLGSARGIAAPASAVLTGLDGTLGQFGYTVASAGDVNGDGYSDVLVGADRVGSFAGRVYVFHGGAAGLSATPATAIAGVASADSHVGAAAAAAGDLNGDGFGDVAVFGANAMTGGRVRVFFGSAAGLMTEAPAVILAPDGASSGFGASLRGGGDVNADGFSDLVVGATGGVGHVYLFTGSAGGVSLTPAATLTGAEPSGSGYGAPLAH